MLPLLYGGLTVASTFSGSTLVGRRCGIKVFGNEGPIYGGGRHSTIRWTIRALLCGDFYANVGT